MLTRCIVEKIDVVFIRFAKRMVRALYIIVMLKENLSEFSFKQL